MNHIMSFLEDMKTQNKLFYIEVQIHHLHGWDLDMLSSQLIDLSLPIIFFVHDFCTICENLYDADSQGRRCRVQIENPNLEKCKGCKYGEHNIELYKACQNFFVTLESLLVSIVAPSQKTMEAWLHSYPSYKDIAVVRGHLQFEGTYKRKEKNSRIRLAYIGSTAEHKGYNEWCHIVNKLAGSSFELFYFGNSDLKMKNIKSVYVDFQKSSKTMEDALREFNIDIAFLWSTSLETYAYTFFEAYAAGCFILTNTASGNIADAVQKYGAGKIFNSISECEIYLSELEYVKKDLKSYVKKTFPMRLMPNQEVESLVYKFNETGFSDGSKNIESKLEENLNTYNDYRAKAISILYTKLRVNY